MLHRPVFCIVKFVREVTHQARRSMGWPKELKYPRLRRNPSNMVAFNTFITVKQWTHQDIQKAKNNLATAVKDLTDTHSHKEVLAILLTRLRNLEQSILPRDRLELYLTIVATLKQDLAFGGLIPTQTRSLINLGFHVLNLSGMKPSTSESSEIYGDFQLLVSESKLKEGDFFQSYWDQSISHHYTGQSKDEAEASNRLSQGIRAMRLGLGNPALEHFRYANQKCQDEKNLNLARLHLIQCLRIQRYTSEASTLIAETLTCHGRFKSIENDIIWQKALITSVVDHDFWPIAKLIKNNYEYYSLSYLSEFKFLLLAGKSRRYNDLLPKTASLKRSKKLKSGGPNFLFQAMSCFESLADEDIPFDIRLKTLGNFLKKAPLARQIEHEMLIWLAATRWLSHYNQMEMAKLSLSRYVGLSMSISNYKMRDSLNLCKDLLTCSWAKGILS